MKQMPEIVEKLDNILKIYPWLKDSKNIVHMPFLDGNSDERKRKHLPGISWKELFDFIEKDYKLSI